MPVAQNSYLWNTGAAGSAIVVTPTSTSVYSVKGANASGACFATQFVTVAVKVCSDTSIIDGIKKLSSENGLIIYPNPTNGKFMLDTKIDLEITVMDCLGKIIVEEKIKKRKRNI